LPPIRRDKYRSGNPPSGKRRYAFLIELTLAWKRYEKTMAVVGQTPRPVIFYACIAGEAANEWHAGML